MRKNEQKRFEAKDKEWAESARPFDKWAKRHWKKSMNFLEQGFDWYFFYDKPRDKGDRAYHIFMWLFATWVIMRTLRII